MNFKKLFPITLIVFSTSSFSSTTTIECTYPKYSNIEGSQRTKSDFVLRYLIDSEADKAYVLGNNGSNEVIKLSGSEHVSFVEITGAGNVMVTTITTNMETVHSRNTVGFGAALIPSQYYGKCTSK